MQRALGSCLYACRYPKTAAHLVPEGMFLGDMHQPVSGLAGTKHSAVTFHAGEFQSP
ncbi:hypothetical protein MES5069_230117 [Mesorhizobium escarrei]|uniref:Uncharacterized protein n=1 Tax=Mesorhizobium escarrei TaxID=666018 RepID=A0ABN8JR85_9HYPH|nr:hypothetical protein MES5069_230117 [Mesorhizobium escarrei]